MAEINEVIERVKTRIEASRIFLGGLTDEDTDALALIAEVLKLSTFDNWSVMDHERMQAELETVRAERDALRAALEDVNARLNAYTPQYYAKDAVLSRIAATVTVALNTQPPQAEWTPRLKDKVRVNMPDDEHHHDQVGTINKINAQPDAFYPYQVRFDRGDYLEFEWYRIDDLIPL